MRELADAESALRLIILIFFNSLLVHFLNAWILGDGCIESGDLAFIYLFIRSSEAKIMIFDSAVIQIKTFVMMPTVGLIIKFHDKNY